MEEPGSRPPSRRRRALYLAVPYAAFVLALAGVEGLVRLSSAHVSSLEFLVAAPEQQAQFRDPFGVRIFEGDPLLFWRLQPNLDRVLWDFTLVTTNARGLRYDRPVGPKPPGVFRVVCLGDSVTFGYRVPRVFRNRPDDYDRRWLPYPTLLEERLRREHPGRAIEVIPLAVPGYSSHQGLAWLRRDAGWLRPDVVTALYGWNDISRRRFTDAEAMPTDWLNTTSRGLIYRSQALIRAWRWLHPRREPSVPGAPGVMRVPRAAYVGNLLAIADLARRDGAGVLLIGPVYRDRLAHPPEGDEIAGHRAALREAARERGIPYLEIPELTEDAHPGNAGLFGEHIHPNHRGHRRLADGVHQALIEHGMLAGLAR